MSTPPPLRVVAWEVTRRCGQRCRHCRAQALPAKNDANDVATDAALGSKAFRPEVVRSGAFDGADPAPGDLAPDEAERVLEMLIGLGPLTLILTGGDPLRRPDLEAIIRRAVAGGLRVAVACCGDTLTAARAHWLRALGVARVSLSLDGVDATTHDGLRGVPGSHAHVLAACAAARDAGLPFQVNSTLHAGNAASAPGLHALAGRLGAVLWDAFLLVPTGRARHWAELALAPTAYDATLQTIAALAQSGGEPPIKVTCAPHYGLLAAPAHGTPAPPPTPPVAPSSPPRPRAAQQMQALHAHPEREGRAASPCLAGRGFLFIGHDGTVKPCGFLDQTAGLLRETDLRHIWYESPLLQGLRDLDRLRGACAHCPEVLRCGGCRARAFEATGDLYAADPLCLRAKGSPMDLEHAPDAPRLAPGEVGSPSTGGRS